MDSNFAFVAPLGSKDRKADQDRRAVKKDSDRAPIVKVAFVIKE